MGPLRNLAVVFLCCLLTGAALHPVLRFGIGLRWPMGPGDVPNFTIQSYGQLEGPSTDADTHHGADLVRENSVLVDGSVQKPIYVLEPVYAMEKGKVVSVECGYPHHSGVLVRSDAFPERALQYLHMDQESIQVNPGDQVDEGDCLGFVGAGHPNWCAPHLHIAHVEGFEGISSSDLPGNELATRNPLSFLDPMVRGDFSPPTIAPGSLSFRKDESGGEAFVPVDQIEALVPIDIIVRIDDDDGLATTEELTWTLAPSLITLIIRDDSTPPLESRWILSLDQVLPSDSPTEGPPDPANHIYNFAADAKSDGTGCTGDTRELYFVLTNGAPTGSGNPNKLGHWLPESGEYTISVLARDVDGNEATPLIQSVTVL